MSESQNIEWKESWRDEYLKWICGFAIAQGGKIYIGMNDDGEVVGVEKSKIYLFSHDITDPYGHGLDDYRIARDEIASELKGLLEFVREKQ